MASYLIADYFTSLIPDFATILPGYTLGIASNGAMALYWSYLFPNDVAPIVLDETRLSERQKYMMGLRLAVTLLPTINSWFTAPQVFEAGAQPTDVKFQDLAKLLKTILPLWQTDLSNAEAAEGIFFTLLPTIPAFLMKIESIRPMLAETIPWIGTTVIQSQAFFEGSHE